MLVITRGYIPLTSHKIPLNQYKWGIFNSYPPTVTFSNTWGFREPVEAQQITFTYDIVKGIAPLMQLHGAQQRCLSKEV